MHWEHAKFDSVLTYRDQNYSSIYTGEQSAKIEVTNMKVFNDSVEGWLAYHK